MIYNDNDRSHYNGDNWFAHQIIWTIDAETSFLYEFWFHKEDGWEWNREIRVTQPYKKVEGWVE